MAELWFAVLCLTLAAYAVLDGFDFGVGTILLFVAKSDAERRDALGAIGPFWDGNEVWLLAAGGVLFVAFPHLLAAAFPAFYLALFVVLWCLVLRGIAIEVRSHVADAMWRAFWDVVFAAASALLALLLGVALGNLVRGVPLEKNGQFTMAFFTDFSAKGMVGLLDWYTLSVGLLTVTLLGAHGAAFLIWRTEGAMQSRARVFARRLAVVAAVAFVGVTLETVAIRPGLFASSSHRPLAWLFTLVAVGGGALFVRTVRGGTLGPFLGSAALILGLLGATAVGVYPVLLYSTLSPEQSLAVRDALGPSYGLEVALGWWPVAFCLAVSYFALTFRANRRKVRAETEE